MDDTENILKEAQLLSLPTAITLLSFAVGAKVLFDIGSATVRGLSSFINSNISPTTTPQLQPGRPAAPSSSSNMPLSGLFESTANLGRAIGETTAKAFYPDVFKQDEFSDIAMDDFRIYSMLKVQTEALKKKIEREKAKRKITEKALS